MSKSSHSSKPDSSGRAQFATRLGVIAATVGSSVGLGNIWRFPFEAGAHGGGAFLVCYLVCILLLGIPVICAEFMMGRAARRGIFGAFRRFAPGSGWHLTGYIGIVASVMILSFYSVVAGWTMEYCWGALTGGLSSGSRGDYHERFGEFITGNWRPALWTLIFLAINYKVLASGVAKGIERVSNVLMPILFVILIAFCVNSLLLPGAARGVAFFFHPDFSQITPGVVIGALGQAFFSLSIGLGTMLTYASYFNARTPLVRTAGIIAGLDTVVAVLSALIVFPAVFTYGMSPEGGPTLVFEVLPTIFHQMPGGGVWAFLFFALLFVASLTSTISMSEISIAFLQEEKRMSRVAATRVNLGCVAVGAVLCALSFGCLEPLKVAGLTIFNLFDYVASNVMLPIGGLLISLFVGWRLPRAVAWEQMGRGVVARVLLFLIRWVAPIGITLIFLNSIGLL